MRFLFPFLIFVSFLRSLSQAKAATAIERELHRHAVGPQLH